MFIKNNIATSYILEISVNQGAISTSVSQFMQTSGYLPTSISGWNIDNSYFGNIEKPLIIVGSYNAINYALQSNLRWVNTNGSGFNAVTSIPPPFTTANITYKITANEIQRTHIQQITYQVYSEYNPFDPRYTPT